VLVRTEPDSRVDRTKFNPEARWLDHAIHVGSYACPHCRVETEFSTATLQGFEALRGLALGEEWNRSCEELRPLGAWEWAFDFRCRGCEAPV